MSSVTRVILMRHGETAWNATERFRGRIEIPLDETGLRQAAAAASWLRAQSSPTAIFSSPLARAVQTAAPIAAEFGLPIEQVEALTDLDFGDWEGLTVPEVAGRYPDLFRLWREAPERLRLPGGESLDDVRERTLAALREIVTSHYGQTVAVVTHRVVCKVLLCAIMGLDNSRFWLIDQASTATNVFDVLDVERSRYIIRTINNLCHLGVLA